MAKKEVKLQSTSFEQRLLTCEEACTSGKQDVGFGKSAGPIPSSPHPGLGPALK